MPARRADVAIIGGGIVGASCAYFLAERGESPLLLETGSVGREASGVNAGGVRQQGRALPEMPLALESLGLWADLEKRLAARLEYERCGDLRIVESEADASRLHAVAAREREVGIGLEWVEGAPLRSLAPALAPTVLGGTFCATGGQANPLLVAPTLARRAREAGAVVWENCAVQRLGRDGEGFALHTANGLVTAARVDEDAQYEAGLRPRLLDEYIGQDRIRENLQVAIAAAKQRGEPLDHVLLHGPPGLGMRLPIELFVPQMQATVPLPRVLDVVLLGFGRRLSMKQAASGAVLIGGGKRGWGNLATRQRGLAADSMRLGVVDAVEVLPVLRGAEMTRSWVGLEGLTPDEMPIIDRLDGGRVYLAAGFCGHGFAIGPVVGRLLAEWLVDGRPSVDVSAFRLDRFAPVAAEAQ